jgi:transcriptional antiterminator RfaH
MSTIGLNDDTEWYAVHTKRLEEERAALNLSRWNVPIFAPRLKERHTSQWRTEYVSKPLFANYIFARFNVVRQLHNINFTRGVHNVVSFGGQPIPIDDEVIEVIKKRLDEDGFVRRGEDFEAGDRVRINSGPFRSLVGVFKQNANNNERVKILLDAMTCQSQLVISRDCINKVD